MCQCFHNTCYVVIKSSGRGASGVFSIAGQIERDRAVSMSLQMRHELLPALSALPGSVDKQELGHVTSPWAVEDATEGGAAPTVSRFASC